MKSYIQLIRIKQWTKNFFCFAGIIFGGYLNNLNLWFIVFQTFISFCFISSSIYILNDILDREADSKHPKKKNRPIPKGDIAIKYAIIIGLVFLGLGLLIAFRIDILVFIVALAYVINNILYNLIFKNIYIIDVFSISFGFILRLSAGIYSVNQTPTSWIILCTFFLALFLGFSKRKAELSSLNKKDNFDQRHVLNNYNEKLLDDLINDSSFGSIISYALFCTSSGNNPTLVVTLPIVYYALTHYKKFLFSNKHGEEPESIILNDRISIWCIILWIILFVSILYYEINIFEKLG